MKKRLVISLLLILALVFTLASCRNKKIESIEILSGTAPTEVYVDEQPDFSGMKLLIKYNDGSSLEVSASDAKIGQVDTSKPGRVSYSIEYQGFTTSASITVKAKDIGGGTGSSEATLTGITYLSGLTTNLFVGFDELDTTSLKVTATYSDGSTRTIDSKDLTTNVAEFDRNVVGAWTLVITYEGKTCEVTITVLEVAVTDFTIDYNTIDTSKSYYVGDTIDTSSITGKAEYNNGSKKDLVNSDFTFSAIDNTTPGMKTLTITYAGISKEISFLFNAVAPTSLKYANGTVPAVIYGDELDTSAITATLTYNNGKTETITASELTFTNINTATPGEKTLRVSYSGFSFDVPYTVLDITAVEIIGINNEVKIGTDIDCTKVQLKLTLSDNTTKFVTEGVTVDKSAFSSAALGKTSVTVNYKNESAQLEIDVVEIVGDATLATIEITGGVKSEIFEGQSFSAEGITLIAKFTDNQFLNLDYSDVTIEGTVGATPNTYTLTVKFTYEGVTKECTHTVTVIEVRVTRLVLNLTEVNIERNPFGNQPNLANLTAVAYYNDGTERNLTLAELNVGTVDVATTGERTLTVSFEEGTDTIKVNVVEPTITDVKLVGVYANKHITGEAYDASGVKAEVYYSNGEVITMSNTDSGVVFNAQTGVLSVTFGGKSASKNITLLTITSVAIDTETFNTAPQVNGFSTEGLKLIVYLSDGTNVIRDVTNGVVIDASGVNDAFSGVYKMTASYLGVTSPEVEILVIDESGYVITGAAYPEGIALWKANTLQESFLDKGYAYAVGNANPFKFELMLTYRDRETDKIFTKYIAYNGVSEVYDAAGNKVGTDIVTIDEKNHTFQFTAKALGNSYTIKTRPENVKAGAEALFTKELTVLVVDGYNVHDEIELNLVTNAKNQTIGNSKLDQLRVLHEFMINNLDAVRGMTLEEYTAFVDSINGIVLHDFLSPSTSDFPEKYFFITSDGKYYLWDHFSMYYRQHSEEGSFNIYGNYFQINTTAIPCVAPPDNTYDRDGVKTNNTTEKSPYDGGSNSEVFRFNITSAIRSAAEKEHENPADNYVFDHTKYNVNIYALAMSDNDKSVAEQTGDERLRSTLGVYAFKIAKGVYNFQSVNIQRYFISVMNEFDCLTVNYDYCTFYDSWNNHLALWTDNDLDKYDNDKAANIHKSHTNIKINIENSFIAKSGGPVIVSSNANPTSDRNSMSGPDITIDENSVLYSYVTGQESWFIFYGITKEVEQVVGIDVHFQDATSHEKAQFTTNIVASNKDYVNMIFVNLSGSGMLGLGDDLDGTLTIGGKALVDMSDTSIYQHLVTGELLQGNYANPYIDTVRLGAKLQNSPMMPPIFVSSDGGCTYFNGYTLDKDMTMGPAFTGDKITLYYENMALLFGYNEVQIDHEPTQRENTTIERVTTAHDYK